MQAGGMRRSNRGLKFGALGGGICFLALLLLPAPYFYLFLNVSRLTAEHYLDSPIVQIGGDLLACGAFAGGVCGIVLIRKSIACRKPDRDLKRSRT
jgi:hypothetical protein